MPKKIRTLTKAQEEELNKLLTWEKGTFDLEVLDGPHGGNPKGRWRVRVSLGRLRVILYEREGRGNIMMDARSTAKGRPQRSTETKDLNTAIARAQEFLKQILTTSTGEDEIAKRIGRAGPNIVTVGLIHDLFRREALQSYEPKFRENLTLIMDLVEAFRGRSVSPATIDDEWVKKFIEWRTSKSLIVLRQYSDKREKATALQPVSGVTALAQAKDYDAVLQWAYKKRLGRGQERLLPSNPLRAINPWPKYEKALRERASDDLYALLMLPRTVADECGNLVVLPAPVDACDPSGLGILRTVLAVQYHTARRRDAVLGLRCGDIVTDPAEVRRALRALRGAHRAEWAETFVNGVIVFRAELDKSGYGRAFPMSKVLRAHIDAHLARLEVGHSVTGDAPLFPRPTARGEPASENTLYKVRSVERRTLKSGEERTRSRKGGWYTEALHLAREYLRREGEDPDRVIPSDPKDPNEILPGFKAHAWRRWWATKFERLGYGKRTSTKEFDLDRHVNFMGSWTIVGGGIREERYVELDPNVLLAIANFEDGMRILERRSDSEEERTADLLERVARSGGAHPRVSEGGELRKNEGEEGAGKVPEGR